jgi:predicted RNase H-like nuclease (RuvC/YqgF family)
MEIPKKIKDSIWDYCKLNDISNIDDFIIKMINQGFSIEKYGSTPFSDVLEKEIVEKVVEVPIEVKIIEYKDREVIKEVPVEVKVIEYVDREVPVEKVVTKIEYISDKSGEDKLGEIIVKLEDDISTLNSELVLEREMLSTTNKEVSKKNKELDELRRSLDELKEKLDDKSKDDKIESLNKQVDNLEKELSKKDKELDELRRSLDVKKEKTKVENKPDIYNEDKKGGWWGSNTMK